MKLYEITGALIQLEQLVDNPEIDETQLAAAFDEAGGELQAKATNIGMLIGNLEATADAIKQAEERMAERRKVIENRVKSIKTYTLRCMQAANIRKIECPLFKLTVRNNPPSVHIAEGTELPLAYLRQLPIPEPQPDKKMLLDDLKQGVVIDGVILIQTQSLVIK